MISNCPVSSLRINSFPANMILLLGFMDSLLRIFSASWRLLTSCSSEGLTFLRESWYSSFIYLYSSCMESYATRAIFFFSCYWRQSASSCLVGLQSSSSSDSQSWKYFLSMPPIQYMINQYAINHHLQPCWIALFRAKQCSMKRQKLFGSFILSMKPSFRKFLRFHRPQGQRISFIHCLWKRQFNPLRYS